MTNLQRQQRYREKMRAAGFKPVTIWVPDTSNPKFAEEARRQAEYLKAQPRTDDDDFWDALAEENFREIDDMERRSESE